MNFCRFNDYITEIIVPRYYKQENGILKILKSLQVFT